MKIAGRRWRIALAVIASISSTTATHAKGFIVHGDAVRLAHLYEESRVSYLDLVTSSSSIEGGTLGQDIERFRTRNCLMLMALEFSSAKEWLHTTSAIAYFAADAVNTTDRKAATVLLVDDLDALEKTVAETRDGLNEEQGVCSNSPLVAQKAQALLVVLGEISSATAAARVQLAP